MSQKITLTNAVPVTFRHFKFLETCVNDILDQTLLSQEIILIISEYKSDNDSEKKISDLKNLISEKKIVPIIRTFKDTQYAGKNRQIAYDLCSSDMIVFQDCDDLTHPQRNEILLKAYQKYEIPHLVHKSFFEKNIKKDNSFQKEREKIILFEDIPIKILKGASYKKFLLTGITNGGAAIVKKTVGNIDFDYSKKRGEDIYTNILLSKKYKTCLLQTKNLYYYLHSNSSWDNIDYKLDKT